MNTFNPFPSGVLLKEVVPEICDELVLRLMELGCTGVAGEMDRLTVPLQQLDGSENSFSCMAYTEPRLTVAERQRIELRDPVSLSIQCSGGTVVIDLDDFGKINWLRVANLPFLYKSLLNSLDEHRKAL